MSPEAFLPPYVGGDELRGVSPSLERALVRCLLDGNNVQVKLSCDGAGFWDEDLVTPQFTSLGARLWRGQDTTLSFSCTARGAP